VHQAEGEVAGEGLHDRLDHPRERDRRREILRLDALELPDREVERLGDGLGRDPPWTEVAVERAPADRAASATWSMQTTW
jgi:hypothetical protein